MNSAEDLNAEHISYYSNFLQILFDNWNLVFIQEEKNTIREFDKTILKYNQDSNRSPQQWNSLAEVNYIRFLFLILVQKHQL